MQFAHGVAGEIDLRDELHGEVFRPLRDKNLFRAVSVNPDWHTVAWPNGANLASEFLHDAVTERPTRRSAHAKSGPAAAAERPAPWRREENYEHCG